jgi:hypothetical protein
MEDITLHLAPELLSHIFRVGSSPWDNFDSVARSFSKTNRSEALEWNFYDTGRGYRLLKLPRGLSVDGAILRLYDIANTASLVCKRWRSVIMEDPDLWCLTIAMDFCSPLTDYATTRKAPPFEEEHLWTWAAHFKRGSTDALHSLTGFLDVTSSSSCHPIWPHGMMVCHTYTRCLPS